MKKIDWQAYHDGSLPASEQAEIKKRLASESKLRTEWQAFQAFHSQIKGALSSDPVPVEKLERMLHFTTQQYGPKVVAGPLLGMLIAGAILTSFLYFGRTPETPAPTAPLKPAAPGPARSSAVLSDPTLARNWAKQKAGFDAPVDLSAVAKLKRVSADPACVRYEYDVKGTIYTVDVRPLAGMTLPPGGTQFDGNTFYARYSGVGFKKGAFLYDIEGPGRETYWMLATTLNKQLNAKPLTATPISCPTR